MERPSVVGLGESKEFGILRVSNSYSIEVDNQALNLTANFRRIEGGGITEIYFLSQVKGGPGRGIQSKTIFIRQREEPLVMKMTVDFKHMASTDYNLRNSAGNKKMMNCLRAMSTRTSRRCVVM